MQAAQNIITHTFMLLYIHCLLVITSTACRFQWHTLTWQTTVCAWTSHIKSRRIYLCDTIKKKNAAKNCFFIQHSHTASSSRTHEHTCTQRVVICLFPMFGGMQFCSAVSNASKTHHYLTYIDLGVYVEVTVCEYVFGCVSAKRKAVDYRVQQAKHCLPWETKSKEERQRKKREARVLEGSRRWFRNREGKKLESWRDRAKVRRVGWRKRSRDGGMVRGRKGKRLRQWGEMTSQACRA